MNAYEAAMTMLGQADKRQAEGHAAASDVFKLVATISGVLVDLGVAHVYATLAIADAIREHGEPT